MFFLPLKIQLDQLSAAGILGGTTSGQFKLASKLHVVEILHISPVTSYGDY